MIQRHSRRVRLEGLTEEETLALLAEDFGIFVQVMYQATRGEALIWDPYLDLICSRMADIAHRRRRSVIIILPPRHLKSFCVSVALPAFVLGHYPGQEVMCISYGQMLAKEFARDCLAVMRSGPYRAAFGDVLLGGRQPLDLFHTRAGGKRRATSLDGTATGVGGDLMIFDDPQKPGETLSEAVRRSTNSAYETTFFSRGTDQRNVRRVIVMQRLHEDDFVSHVLGLGGDWDVLNLPAIAEEDQAIPYSTALGDFVYFRAAGEALHPGRTPLATLNEIRQTLGEAIWATQYQQRPAPAGGGMVKVGWFKRYADADLPDCFDRVIQSWDTASKAGEWNDFSVCTTWGLKGKHAWLLHVFRERLIYPDLKRAVLDQARLHGATEVFVEDTASGTQLIQELRREGYGKLRPVKATRDKATRMINQTALIENGFVHVPVEAPWLAEYLHELAVFPNGRWDDQVDSTSQALEAMDTWSGGYGILEYIRQEKAAAREKAEGIRRRRKALRKRMEREGY